LTKLSLAEKCGTCHEYQYKLHQSGIHGEQLAKGNPDVATCVDCHSPTQNPHSVIRVLEYNAPAYKKNIAQTCASCHDNEELMADYGIVEKVYESYMRSFHEKAIQLGTYEATQLDKATCTNCHGVHDIKSAKDPGSPVVGVANLASTCEQCHPGAGVEFAKSFLGHKEASPQNVAAAHNTKRFFTILLVTVAAFAVMVVAMAIVRFSINRWREYKDGCNNKDFRPDKSSGRASKLGNILGYAGDGRLRLHTDVPGILYQVSARLDSPIFSHSSW